MWLYHRNAGIAHIPTPMIKFIIRSDFFKMLVFFFCKKNIDGIMKTVIAIIGVDNAAITFTISKFAAPDIQVIMETSIAVNNLFFSPRDAAVSTIPVRVPVYAPLVIKIIVIIDIKAIMPF